MKFEKRISRKDFQAPPPYKPPNLFGGGASAD
jgi:hypothetical protein